MTTHVQLTEQQRQLVEETVDARLLVTAPAGSGKTLSLVHRLAHLIEEEELEPSELLVLSFSRAAVSEVRQRLTTFGTAAAHVDVRTFDSFATWLLSEVVPDGLWQRQGFGPRIREATRLIKEDPDAGELIGELRHLIVDEVQDLVGDRAELILALLGTDIEGFTLLGDPAQGIYGFQLDDPQERLEGAARLYAEVRKHFNDDLVEVSLAGNFRAREPEARAALIFGDALGPVDAPFAEIQRGLRSVLMAGDSLGTIDQAAPVMARMTGTTAVLCRSNDEVLLVSRRLHDLGVRHRLQHSAQDKVIPSWVGSLYRELDSKQPKKREVLEVLRNAGPDPESSWELLRRMDPSHRGETLDLPAIRKRLIRGDFPDELTKQTSEGLVVSTIHRAKGLEFDQVIVLDPGDAPEDDPIEQAERARLLYVAMTRPRDLLIHVKPIAKLTTGRLQRQGDGRWAELGFKAGRNLGMEIRSEDVNWEEPPGTLGFEEDPQEIQNYLATAVREGDPVALVRLPVISSEDFASYAVDHEGRHIGVTTESFARAFRALLPGRDRRLPPKIKDLRVDTMETVIGREAAGLNAGLGWSGVWLRPRIVGLGRFDWAGERS
ncbi:UvrD-helicase domain-containing protein [Actinomadura alba]|uniref:UvrD-helicase domain-containing protein n=1 Tax=Actinomadura alba TaxID=406431 RepID=A0ABR7LP77_9ACTN|nr:UvrD-helicase domain-containing protein [Actinomadura alba]MBC6466652.1 UvrD-helicase domain-containing protein [Actinomadura alba]